MWFRTLLCLIVSLVSLSSLAPPARADMLLVVAHSQYMFGDEKTSLAFEKLGAGLVEFKLHHKYRKVFKWFGAKENEIPFRQIWNEIMEARQQNEPLDVFVMEHGGMGILSYDGFVAHEQVPYGMIRRYYTTGCGNWGLLESSDVEMQTPSWRQLIWRRTGYGLSNSQHLERLGVREYIMHANNNSTGMVSLPMVADQLVRSESWIEGFARGMDRVDDMTGLWIPSLFDVARSFGILDEDLPEDVADEIHEWIRSRPVFGGADLPSHLESFGSRAVKTVENEILVRPTPILAYFLRAYCPEAFSGVWDSAVDVRREHCRLWKETQDQEPSAVNAIHASAGLLQNLVGVMSPDGSGCLPPGLLQDLVGAHFSSEDGTSPTLSRICFKRRSATEFVVEWRYSDAESKDFWKLGDASAVQVETDGGAVEGVILKNKGELRIRIEPSRRARLDFKGVGIRMASFPGLFRNVGLRGLHIREDGRYSARISSTFLRIPISLNGNYEREVRLKIKLFGFLGFKAPE